MAAAVVEIAEAVVAALNAAGLSLGFEAVRVYAAVRELSEVKGLEVIVASAEQELARLSRGAHDFDYAIHVGVLKRIGDGALTEGQIVAACDPLMAFVEEIVDLFRGPAGDDLGGATLVGVENAPIYDQDAIDTHRVFASVVVLRLKKARART